MIQRIQSVWLLLAALCTAAMFKFSFYSGTNAKGEASYQLNAGETMLLTITSLLVVIVLLITIALFKNRSLQIKLSVGGIILSIVQLLLFFKQSNTFSTGTYSLTALLPILAIVLTLLAILSIRKDEKMVKNSDRLR